MYFKNIDTDTKEIRIISRDGFTNEDIINLREKENIIYSKNCPCAIIFDSFNGKKSIIRIEEVTKNKIVYKKNKDTFDGEFLENVSELLNSAINFNNVKSKQDYIEKHKNEKYNGFNNFMENI